MRFTKEITVEAITSMCLQNVKPEFRNDTTAEIVSQLVTTGKTEDFRSYFEFRDDSKIFCDYEIYTNLKDYFEVCREIMTLVERCNNLFDIDVPDDLAIKTLPFWDSCIWDISNCSIEFGAAMLNEDCDVHANHLRDSANADLKIEIMDREYKTYRRLNVEAPQWTWLVVMAKYIQCDERAEYIIEAAELMEGIKRITNPSGRS